MIHNTFKWRLVGAALLAAAALAGCHDNNNNGSSSTPPPASTKFSVFVETVYAEGPNTVPINFDNVNFDYDVDNDPTAFDTLLM